MKLQSLHENSVNFTLRNLARLPDTVAKGLEEIINKYAAGKYKIAQFHQTSDRMCQVVLGNNLVSIEINIAIDASSQNDMMEMSVYGLVNKEYLAKRDEQIGVIIDNSTNLSSTFDEAVEDLTEQLETTDHALSEFTDWYFDVSGKYGKVKIYSTTYGDLTAVAGRFVNEDGTANEFTKEVY